MDSQKTTIVVRLILEKDEEILFLKKTPQNGGGYSLVGGKLDNGEDASEAIIRESFEEANIHIKRKHLRLIHLLKRDPEHELVLIFTAKKWKGNLESRELEKFKKVVWVDKFNLPKSISSVTELIIDSFFNSQFFVENEK